MSELPLADLLSLTLREDKGEDLLASFRTLSGIERAGVEGLQEAGVSRAAATRLLAAMELARRYVAEPAPSTVLRSPAEVARYIAPELTLRQQETFVVIMLSAKNAPIAHKVVSIGTANATLVHPRELFRPAIRSGAVAVIACHNHPSGDPTPSAEDLALTKRLKEAGQVLGIELLDHLIIGAGGSYVSLKERGLA
ncbi:MAG: RadC family protein [Bacteroidota bacterium]